MPPVDDDPEPEDYEGEFFEPDFEDLDEFLAQFEARDAKILGYRRQARDVILEMLDEHHAVVPLEIVARAGDYPWRDSDLRLDQHHLQFALADLIAAGTVVRNAAVTRGGRSVTVIHRSDMSGAKRAIERAAGRKRLLDARYLGWASGTEKGSGVIGPTAERVVHRSLRDAAPVAGLQVVNPETGFAAQILGVPVRRGPLDNAAVYNPVGALQPFAIAIEVKSLRPWIYPRDPKLYQILYKAAMLSQELGNAALVIPVFVCRKAHVTTFRMARELGFHVIDTLLVQWLPQLEAVPLADVIEIREGLGYVDLYIWDGSANKNIKKHFETVIPGQAARIAKRWAQIGSQFADEYEWLWDHSADEDAPQRQRRLNDLRADVRRLVRQLPLEDRFDREGGW